MIIVCVIPCYNEANTIGDVIWAARKYADRIIVIDNNSTDGTTHAARQAGSPTYISVHGCMTKGAGAATACGLWWALDPALRADIIVTLDGDGQHDPEYIPNLVQPIEHGDADIVIGSRLKDEIPLYRRLGIGVITHLYNVRGDPQSRIRDGQSCFRALTREATGLLLPIEERGFGFSTEMLIKARQWGLRIAETPIPAIYHSDLHANSTANPVRHGVGVALATLKWRLKCGC